jgi:hypothetical protein
MARSRSKLKVAGDTVRPRGMGKDPVVARARGAKPEVASMLADGDAMVVNRHAFRMMPVLVCVLLLAGSLAASSSLAQHGPGGGPPTFEEFDLDGDGGIGEAEFYEARGRRIAERASEGRQMKHLSEAPLFEEIDTDGNGTVDPAEFAGHHGRSRGLEPRE